ncbi:DUF1905 domain-containing protein [Alteraurantiacibacter aquimixticola]|uniref:DUF1905 domain-containing protein n=1 Tax=Alteraurantiacibacter aquimixticola TaxID=2489173 RepID=A0A4T3EZ28_9SPHN|nr:DUF1905 domain-containing protein [Alteraurantiacibacter aquimixticola]TIX49801.1 DUF1905 domain-containing protein [Alteraurantiacibacter aquimixticola]
MSDPITHHSQIWLWSGAENGYSWHFVTLDGEAAEAIRAHEAMRRLELGPNAGRRRGFGSVKVAATIGETRWTTSVFPSKPQDGYILPLKLAVRKAEDLAAGDMVAVELELL